MTPDGLTAALPGGLDWQPGDVFPDLELPGVVDSEPRRLSEWRGRAVMLHLFASW